MLFKWYWKQKRHERTAGRGELQSDIAGGIGFKKGKQSNDGVVAFETTTVLLCCTERGFRGLNRTTSTTVGRRRRHLERAEPFNPFQIRKKKTKALEGSVNVRAHYSSRCERIMLRNDCNMAYWNEWQIGWVEPTLKSVSFTRLIGFPADWCCSFISFEQMV